MKIGIFDSYMDDLGGGEKYMMTIATCLSQHHDVSVFWDNASDLDVVEQRFALDFSRISRVENIFRPGFSFFKRLFETKKYDVILFLSDGSIPITFSKKLFIHIQQPLEQFQSSSLKDRLKLARVNGIFCNSEYTKHSIEKRFDVKTSIIYPPVGLHPRNLKKENIILHVGRFRVKNVPIGDYKKQYVMIDIFKQMIKHGLKNWKFIIAASVQEKDREAFEEMRKTAKGLPIEFVINSTNEKLWKMYSKAKIYWHASGFGEDLEKHPEYAEHFGIATVEAMGAGAVPVVIDAGGQTEIVSDGKNGFLWNTKEECADETERVIKDTHLWEQLSHAAMQRAKDFDENEFCKKITSLIS